MIHDVVVEGDGPGTVSTCVLRRLCSRGQEGGRCTSVCQLAAAFMLRIQFGHLFRKKNKKNNSLFQAL